MSSISFIKDDGTFQYTLLTPKYLDAALNIQRSCFYKDEAVFKACRVSEDPEAIEELITRCDRPCIELGLSMVAIEKATDHVAAIQINKINLEQPSKSDIETFINSVQWPAARDLMKTYSTIETSCNLFELFDGNQDEDDEGRQNCIIEMYGLCTLPQYRGRRIGQKLIELTIEMVTALNRRDRITNYFKTDENKTSFVADMLRPKMIVSILSSVATQKYGKLLNFRVATSTSFDTFETYRGEKFSSIVDDEIKNITLVYKKLCSIGSNSHL